MDHCTNVKIWNKRRLIHFTVLRLPFIILQSINSINGNGMPCWKRTKLEFEKDSSYFYLNFNTFGTSVSLELMVQLVVEKKFKLFSKLQLANAIYPVWHLVLHFCCVTTERNRPLGRCRTRTQLTATKIEGKHNVKKIQSNILFNHWLQQQLFSIFSLFCSLHLIVYTIEVPFAILHKKTAHIHYIALDTPAKYTLYQSIENFKIVFNGCSHISIYCRRLIYAIFLFSFAFL